MLMPLDRLITKFDLNIMGVFHVGAHHAEELEIYEQCGVPRVVWVEGDGNSFDETKRRIARFEHHSAYKALLDSKVHSVEFHVANNGQSSSILELGTHLQHHPEVSYVAETKVQTSTVDALFKEHQLTSLNFWNLDVQGVELRVLEGAEIAMSGCDYIYTEVNDEEVYVDCALVTEIDAFLTDFTRVATEWTPHHWGDALYVRSNTL